MKPEYWPIINTLISATIGAIVAISTFYFQGRRNKAERKREEYDSYKRYSKPIMLAAESLAWRLKEVLKFNGAFLLPDAPMNGFFKYKFDSTIYRLCALIGWIRAAQKENSYIEGFSNTKNSDLRKSINSFKEVLADGNHVEVSIFEELSKLYGLNIIKINNQTRLEIGVELEKIVFKFIPDQVKKNVSNLDNDLRFDMISEIMNLICIKTDQSTLSKEIVLEQIDIAIEEVAREYCWIYRDWQNAIGDEMLKPLNGKLRQFDVLGFNEFVSKHEDNLWLKKVDNLFSNLDVSIDNRFDTRVSQVKLIYISLVKLIVELNKAIEDEEAISNEGLGKLEDFANKLREKENTSR